MSDTQHEPKPTRRGLWLVVAAVGSLLALTTWDLLHNSGENSPADLRRAAFDGDGEKVRRILAAHPEWIDSVGSAKAPSTVADRFSEVVLIALGTPSPSPASPPELTPLVHAVMRQHIDVARMLLEAGAKVRVEDAYGYPLAVNAIQRGDTNFLAALEARGAMLHAIATGWEPWLLHAAVHSGQAEMVQLIMGRGHSLNGTNSVGGTPLWLAIASHRLDLVQLLATNGANFTCVPARGQSAVEIARAMSADTPSSNAIAVATWLEAFAATNLPPAKPAP